MKINIKEYKSEQIVITGINFSLGDDVVGESLAF